MSNAMSPWNSDRKNPWSSARRYKANTPSATAPTRTPRLVAACIASCVITTLPVQVASLRLSARVDEPGWDLRTRREVEMDVTHERAADDVTLRASVTATLLDAPRARHGVGHRVECRIVELVAAR